MLQVDGNEPWWCATHVKIEYLLWLLAPGKVNAPAECKPCSSKNTLEGEKEKAVTS